MDSTWSPRARGLHMFTCTSKLAGLIFRLQLGTWVRLLLQTKVQPGRLQPAPPATWILRTHRKLKTSEMKSNLMMKRRKRKRSGSRMHTTEGRVSAWRFLIRVLDQVGLHD